MRGQYGENPLSLGGQIVKLSAFKRLKVESLISQRKNKGELLALGKIERGPKAP